MATVHNKYEQQLLNDFMEYLDNGIIPWEQNWLKKEAINEATNRAYHGINALMLNVCANKHHYEDPRWVTLTDIDKKEYVLNNKLPPKVHVWSRYQYFEVNETGKWTKKISEQLYYEKRKVNAKSVVQEPVSYELVNMECIKNRLPMKSKELDETIDSKQKTEFLDILINTYLQKEGITIETSDLSSYNAVYKKIRCPESSAFSSLEEYQNLLLHYICHHEISKTLVKNDEEKTQTSQVGTVAYAQEELKADLIQFFLFKKLDIDFVEQSMDSNKEYIPLWKKQLENRPYDFLNFIKTARLSIVPQILKSMDYEINQLQMQQDLLVPVLYNKEFYIFDFNEVKALNLDESNKTIYINGSNVTLYQATNDAEMDEIKHLATIHKKQTHYLDDYLDSVDENFDINDNTMQF